MKKSINNLLIKSYMKKKDFLIYIITICILSILIINFLNTALYIGGEYLKKIAKESKDANDFENKVKAQYPEYSGLNYLDMISVMFFSQN